MEAPDAACVRPDPGGTVVFSLPTIITSVWDAQVLELVLESVLELAMLMLAFALVAAAVSSPAPSAWGSDH